MEKLLVVGPFNDAMKQALRQAFSSDFELEYITSRGEYSKLADADFALIRTLNFTAEDIAGMKKIKMIQRWGVGYDTVDIEAAAKRGIPVAVNYGMNATPVSEMAIALTLAIYRNLVPLTVGIKAGKWEREQFAKISYTIDGKTVGIVGFGNIGRKVAALYSAFGANVFYFDPRRPSAQDEAAAGVTYSELDALWGKCDIISLHAPLTNTTNRIVNQETLAKMKDGAVLINTAREELVDSHALAEALTSGKLLGAGLDAIEESFLADNPFTERENVVLSAHLGGNTADNVEHMAIRCAEQIMAVSRGEKLEFPYVVNAHLFK